MVRGNIRQIFTLSLASLLLVACASTGQNQYAAGNLQINDPFEETNRAVFAFNKAVDKAVVHPLITGYRTVVPQPARSGVTNFLTNLKSPVTFANQLLQGDLNGAKDVFLRATINTLIGVGGLFDVAGYEGIEYETEDFGQTLGVWGIGHGPYLVVPLLGPSSLRDYTGYAVDSFADPLRWYLFNIDREGLYYTRLGAEYFDLRNSLMDVLQDLEASSIDYYAAVRSTYYQSRDALVKDQIKSPTDSPAITYDEYEFPDYGDF